MTALSAVLKQSVLEAAKDFVTSGLSILPLRGKQPALKSWRYYQKNRPYPADVRRWHEERLLSGVGLICGRISGNLVVLDFDSQAAVEEFEDTFPTLIDTLTVLSGSGRGAHFYYYVKQLPETTLAPNYELRADGCYVVAPPSPHPSGNLYRVYRATEPLRLVGMPAVLKWVKSKRPSKLHNANDLVNLVGKPQAPHTGAFVPREEYFRNRYLNTAIAAQVQLVSTATEGYRNSRLYFSAVALGQLVGSGELARSRVETELLNAALTCGLEQIEAERTIKSGIDAGSLRPRRVPPAPKPLL